MENKEITLSTSAVDRILELKSGFSNKEKHLRITVFGGGCNGLRYEFTLDNKHDQDDIKIMQDSQILLTIDQTSLEFINGGIIDFVRDLGSSYFKIINPNAKSSCGCGDSFSV